MQRNKKGFTVAEVLVASAIFMVFSGALFSIYRMGSRMFVSGAWKYNRQKEAERFFEILKERVEQASNIVKIEPNSA
ncbi:MAG: prepilin-type N-terminal cleavage/methylation domain-containing protein, partial [Candidatus Riflebacteria bacterium]|nr:prepilin-type N-terminal cleavage/methylation domain-containing protein [Candidatus Riflebacteria bacterium]